MRTIVAVPLYLREKIEQDSSVFESYCRNKLGMKEAQIIIMGIKKNTPMKIGGFPLRLRGSSSIQLKLQNDVQLILEYRYEEYLKKLEKYIVRNMEYTGNKLLTVSEHEGISNEKNCEIYTVLRDKIINTIYEYRPANQKEIIVGGYSKFKELTLEEQCIALNEILNLFRCKPISADLRLIGGPPRAGEINKNINLSEETFMFHQSVTGLFETKVDLLTCKKRP